MKYLLIFSLIVTSLSASAEAPQFGLYNLTLNRNLDANDGICSTSDTVELFFDIYSLNGQGLKSTESRVYGEARIQNFQVPIRIGSSQHDWNLKVKRPLNIDSVGNFKISYTVNDSDACGVGLWPIGKLSLNHDKILDKKIIRGNIKELNFKSIKGGKCRALIPAVERGSNSVLDATIEILKDC